MSKQEQVQLFGSFKVRTVWDSETEKWYFSIVDTCAILTDQPDYDHAKNYWKVLKHRLIKEGAESVTNCNQLKLISPKDGKRYKTDVATDEQLFRIIQSIPSKKAEPLKQWMAQVASQRIRQMQDPELGIQQSLQDFKRLGYPDNWINQRLKSIEIRKDLTDQWKLHGVQEGQEYATLTDIIYQAWAGLSAKEYKQYKGLRQENLRDNMTNEELVMNMLAELTTTNINREEHPANMEEHAKAAVRGGSVAKVARDAFEQQTGKKVVSSMNMKKYLDSQQPQLPFDDIEEQDNNETTIK